MEEEEAVHLKINPTLFVPEQSISGGRVGVEGGGTLKKKKKKTQLLEWQITWENFLRGKKTTPKLL